VGTDVPRRLYLQNLRAAFFHGPHRKVAATPEVCRKNDRSEVRVRIDFIGGDVQIFMPLTQRRIEDSTGAQDSIRATDQKIGRSLRSAMAFDILTMRTYFRTTLGKIFDNRRLIHMSAKDVAVAWRWIIYVPVLRILW
jgi:hypothetical protein